MQDKINLLHLITGLSCGGAEKMVYQLCKYSDKTLFNVSVVSIDDTNYFFSKLKKLQIRVSKLGLKKNPIAFFNGILSLNKLIRKYKIQIIHAHLFHAMVMSCVIKLLNPKLKIIWTGHNSRMISLRRSLIALVTRRIRTHDIHLQAHLEAWYNTICSSTIPNGIEFPKVTKNIQKFDEFTFISVGNLEEQKNHIFLIELFSIIDNYKLLIVGGGSEKKALQARINELGLTDNITLLGHRDDVYKLMQKSHCFLLPSLWEGLPLAVLESAYVKLPIITSSIISMKKLISDDEGYVVSFNEFEEAIYSVVNNYVDAENRAKRFYERVRIDFNILTCIRSHENLYRYITNA